MLGWITILRINTENQLKYSFQSVFNAVPALRFRNGKVSIAIIRLVSITISQLKCALHISIGDWFDSVQEMIRRSTEKGEKK